MICPVMKDRTKTHKTLVLQHVNGWRYKPRRWSKVRFAPAFFHENAIDSTPMLPLSKPEPPRLVPNWHWARTWKSACWSAAALMGYNLLQLILAWIWLEPLMDTQDASAIRN